MLDAFNVITDRMPSFDKYQIQSIAAKMFKNGENGLK